MSQDATERTKLGPGFDILDISGTPTTVYRSEEEMEDTATSSVKLVGETIPELDASSLGLSPQNPITADSLRSVTGARTSETRSSSDAEAQHTARDTAGERVYDPAAGGSHVPPADVSHQAGTMASTFKQPKSPELRDELQQMRTKITGAEKNANAAQRIVDSAEQRADSAQRRADAAEQRAVAAQDIADTAKQKQVLVEEELRNASSAFRQEKEDRARDSAAAQLRIDALQKELNEANVRINAHGTVVQDVVGLGSELRIAQHKMTAQSAEMRQLGTLTDEMIEQVGDLTDAFHQIDDERQRANVTVNPVKSTSVHVQGTTSHVKEPAGNVQTAPDENVIDLVSQGTDGGSEHGEEQKEDGHNWLSGKPWSVRGRMNTLASNTAAADSSTILMTSATLSTGIAAAPQATSSQDAMRTGSMNHPPMIHEAPQSTRRVIVSNPPQLPSGIQRAIERIVQAHMERVGIHAGSPMEYNRGETATVSTARNITNPGPENSQFSFPQMGESVAPPQGQQVFATAQWRPKEPPAYTGNASDDVYLWTSLVRQYFVFMCRTARQEVAFAATLLRGAAHEWYLGYERRNGGRPPQDWPTMRQAILDRFGSNIRAQEAHAKLLTLSQGKRSVRDYTSEFETLLGRLSTRDETTWKNMYIWGLQPHLAEAVALKYPTTIAQAAGHAEEIELAKKASQRPNLGNQGACPTGNFRGQGGSHVVPRTFAQGRRRGNAGTSQRGGGRDVGGRRGGGWSRGRQGGFVTSTSRSGTQCYNCGQYGHYASQCPRNASTSGTSSIAPSVNQRSTFTQNRGNRNGRGGNRRGGGNRRTQFSGLSVVYDAEGNEYPIDEDGNIVLDFIEEEEAATLQQNTEKSGN